MATFPEQFISLQQKSLKAIEAYALASLQGVEKLTELNLQAARASVEEGVQNSVALFQSKDPKALAETLSDEIDIERRLEHDEALSFRRPGISQEALAKLRRGHWVVQAALDLHGLRRDEARDAVGRFLPQAVRDGLRCVRIIHGKGLGSIDRKPVLKDKVLRWLVQREEVIAFCEAPPHTGGSGALLVLLRPPLAPSPTCRRP